MSERKIVSGRTGDTGARIPGWNDYVFSQADAVAAQYSDPLVFGEKKGEFLFACETVRQCVVYKNLPLDEKKRKLRFLLSEHRLTEEMMENLWEHAGGDGAILKTMINDEKVP